MSATPYSNRLSLQANHIVSINGKLEFPREFVLKQAEARRKKRIG